jgi:hypothetical protein
LVNWIFENLQILKTLKSGIACPILKKGKPAHDPNSLSPVMPKVYKSRNNPVCQTRSKALRASINATYKGDLLFQQLAYKIFINPLLDTLERNQLGAYLGTHYCGTPTVADDVTLISNDPYELQSMLYSYFRVHPIQAV